MEILIFSSYTWMACPLGTYHILKNPARHNSLFIYLFFIF